MFFKFNRLTLSANIFSLQFIEISEYQPSSSYRASKSRFFPYIHCKFCRVCPTTKMASATVKPSVPDITNRWSMTSVCNQWVMDDFSWFDYWRWSMSNQWVIEAQKYCGLSIAHQWHWLLIDVIDHSAMTHRLLIDYYTAHERHFSCLLVSFNFFRLWFFYQR